MLDIDFENKIIKGNAKAGEIKKKGLILASADEMDSYLE